MRKTRLSAVAVLGVAAVLAPLAAFAGPASAAATPNPNAPEQVATGVNVAHLPGTTVFGSTPASTPETVSFILQERNSSLLRANVLNGVTKYLTVSQFASTYGQTPANVSALTSYLAGFGIKTTVYADNVDVSATGTAGEFDAALSVTQNQYHVPARPGIGGQGGIPAQTVHGIAQAPLLPYRLSNFVLAILGLTNYSPYASHTAHVNTSVFKPQQGNANSCIALTGLAGDCNLPSDFATNYGLNGLYAKGANGSGTTLGIITLAAVDPSAPQFFWQNIAKIPNTGRTFTIQNIDGGPGAPSNAAGTGETDLDIEQSGALAPGANVIDYQAPNTDPGFADAFFAAASQNTADTVSTSWGEAETVVKQLVLSGEEPATYNAAFDEAFLEFAEQGQSSFDASGDSGAYDASAEIGTTNLSIDTNSDSPYITATGGTTLPLSATVTGPDGTASISVPSQRIWGWDYLWAPIAKVTGTPELQVAEANILGGGGGFSSVYGLPQYQQFVTGTRSFNAVQYLTPIDPETIAPGLVEPTAWTLNPTPSVTSGSGSGRATPDVSADADPNTGYLLYSPSFAQAGDPVLEGGWGGTSFVAPQMNGYTAVIDSALGHRVGFWNPSIYAVAGGFRSPFNPLNVASPNNDNLYYTGQPGDAFNHGVGLGIPNLTALSTDFIH